VPRGLALGAEAITCGRTTTRGQLPNPGPSRRSVALTPGVRVVHAVTPEKNAAPGRARIVPPIAGRRGSGWRGAVA
jgi:hypothetical protein